MYKEEALHELLPMNLQFFAGESEGGSEFDQLDSLLSGAGQEEEQEAEEEVVEEETTEEESEEEEQPQQQQKQKPNKAEQQEFAFAQMRRQNAQLKQLLDKVAKATGVEYQNEQELYDKLNNTALEQLAQKQQIPVQLLQRLEMLEANNTAYQADQMRIRAMNGFQQLKDTYSLSDAELRNFAQELTEANKNPFLTNVDIINEYKLAHFDDIVQKKVEAATKAVLNRSNVAEQHSSKPNKSRGTGAQDDIKVDSVSALNSLLNGLK